MQYRSHRRHTDGGRSGRSVIKLDRSGRRKYLNTRTGVDAQRSGKTCKPLTPHPFAVGTDARCQKPAPLAKSPQEGPGSSWRCSRHCAFTLFAQTARCIQECVATRSRYRKEPPVQVLESEALRVAISAESGIMHVAEAKF